MCRPPSIPVLALATALFVWGCSSSGADPAVPFERCFEALRAARFIDVQSYSGTGVKVQRARTPGDEFVPGETFAYRLIRFAIESDGKAVCVSSSADMKYRYGHHNWDDAMEARDGDLAYRVTEKRLDVGSWEFELTTLDARTGATRSGPQRLADAGCFTIPFDLNGCPGRMRTDR